MSSWGAREVVGAIFESSESVMAWKVGLFFLTKVDVRSQEQEQRASCVSQRGSEGSSVMKNRTRDQKVAGSSPEGAVGEF